MQNTKYEVTDIKHWRYTFLRRIRALRDIGDKVKAGDLGGFVESEQNLSYEQGDDAWLFDDAICCNDARVDGNSILKDNAEASGKAYITGGSILGGTVQAADRAQICGAKISFACKALENCVIAPSRKTGRAPMMGGDITVYGSIIGDVRVSGKMALMENERIYNSSKDTLVIVSGHRTIIPNDSRAVLKPMIQQPDRIPNRSNVVAMAR